MFDVGVVDVVDWVEDFELVLVCIEFVLGWVVFFVGVVYEEVVCVL